MLHLPLPLPITIYNPGPEFTLTLKRRAKRCKKAYLEIYFTPSLVSILQLVFLVARSNKSTRKNIPKLILGEGNLFFIENKPGKFIQAFLQDCNPIRIPRDLRFSSLRNLYF